jgi:hypothetical protein
MIYIFSSENIAKLKNALEAEKKLAWIKLLPAIPSEHVFNSGDQAYLDVSGLTPGEIKENIGLLKKDGCFWGIIDPKGTVEDPASFFFDGAFDYIGSGLIKKGLNKKRFAAALSWFEEKKPAANESKTGNITDDANNRKIQKLPGGKFEGWKSIRAGTTGFFFFLFVSFSGKTNLRSKLGESVYNTVKKQLREIMQQNLFEADALLWMETEENSLFLVPPRAANGQAVIEAALRMVLNSQLISIEDLNLSIPVDFTFALHYGQTTYQAPGKTGAVVSDSVNFIFHLGTKRAQAGRLTLSGDVPEEVIPDGFNDFFRSNGMYEGISVNHSRLFVFE